MNLGEYVETNSICDISPSGHKVLSRYVYDIGAAGYNLTYYVVEKHFLFERRYVVAVRGQMSFREDNKFINEDTLTIQGIIYDISGHNVVFKQGGTNKEMRRKKRKNILFPFKNVLQNKYFYVK